MVDPFISPRGGLPFFKLGVLGTSYSMSSQVMTKNLFLTFLGGASSLNAFVPISFPSSFAVGYIYVCLVLYTAFGQYRILEDGDEKTLEGRAAMAWPVPTVEGGDLRSGDRELFGVVMRPIFLGRCREA